MELKNNQLYLLINLKIDKGIRSYVYELDWNDFYKNYTYDVFVSNSHSKFNYRLNSITCRYILHKKINKNSRLYAVNNLYDLNKYTNCNEPSTIYMYNNLKYSAWSFTAILFVPHFRFKEIAYTLSGDRIYTDISYDDLTQVLKRCVYHKQYANNRDIWYSDIDNIDNNVKKELVINNWVPKRNDLYEQLTFKF